MSTIVEVSIRITETTRDPGAKTTRTASKVEVKHSSRVTYPATAASTVGDVADAAVRAVIMPLSHSVGS